MRMPVDEEEYERRLRLVLLTYEVLKDVETPTDEATSAAMFFLLSQAFLDKATTLANLEVAKPKGRGANSRVSASVNAAMLNSSR
jgi:hypothetical protein